MKTDQKPCSSLGQLHVAVVEQGEAAFECSVTGEWGACAPPAAQHVMRLLNSNVLCTHGLLTLALLYCHLGDLLLWACSLLDTTV
jgi:hypothetical protein